MHAGVNPCLCVYTLVSHWLVLFTLTKTKQIWLFKQMQCMSSVSMYWDPACTWVCAWGTRECRCVVCRLHALQGRTLGRSEGWAVPQPLLWVSSSTNKQVREQAGVSQQNHLHSSELMGISLVLISKGVLKNISVQRSSLSKEDLWISFDWCLCSLFPVIQVNVFETWSVVS